MPWVHGLWLPLGLSNLISGQIPQLLPLKKKKKKNRSLKTNKNPRTETPEELALPQLHFLSFSRPSKKLQEQFSPLVSPMGKLRPREAKGLLQGSPPRPWFYGTALRDGARGP